MVRLYPLAIIVCYLPLTILTIIQAMDEDFSISYLNFSIFAVRLIGFANAIIYGVTNRIWNNLCKQNLTHLESSLNTF